MQKMSFQTPSKFIIWKEIEAMKSQAEGLTREYDRVCEELQEWKEKDSGKKKDE